MNYNEYNQGFSQFRPAINLPACSLMLGTIDGEQYLGLKMKLLNWHEGMRPTAVRCTQAQVDEVHMLVDKWHATSPWEGQYKTALEAINDKLFELGLNVKDGGMSGTREASDYRVGSEHHS